MTRGHYTVKVVCTLALVWHKVVPTYNPPASGRLLADGTTRDEMEMMVKKEAGKSICSANKIFIVESIVGGFLTFLQTSCCLCCV